ncbi:MAG: DUF302 domain-containing protein [Sphingomicrobium sp.]
MQFYLAKTMNGDFGTVLDRVKEALKGEGFGILSDIDVRETMKLKLNLEFREYRILGACNPSLAHQALSIEDKIGVMLPCNVIVQSLGNGQIEVAAINPAATMANVGEAALAKLADTVADKLKIVLSTI